MKSEMQKTRWRFAIRQTAIHPNKCDIDRQSGFTLLELLVVIAIIGLLAAYVGPRYFSQLGKSEQGAAKAQVDALAKALDAYRLDTGNYPSTSQGLQALVSRPAGEQKWQGPYLQGNLPLDPWGRPYMYSPQENSRGFLIKSLGKDGAIGGESENQDINLP